MAVRVETAPLRADWKRGRVASWLTTVDHKRIGLLYIATSLVFLLAGGLLAILMRAATPTAAHNGLTEKSPAGLGVDSEKCITAHVTLVTRSNSIGHGGGQSSQNQIDHGR